MKILCVSWHYPPSSEIAGKVLYRFTRALAARGHELIVVTAPVSSGIAPDAGFGPDLANVRVVRVKPWPDPVASAARLKNRLMAPSVAARASLDESATPRGAPASSLRRFLDIRHLPDRANTWIVPVRRTLRRLVREEHPDLLLSISPFFSAHLAALDVHRSFPNLPWWAWSHDPASGNPFELQHMRVREGFLSRWEAAVARGATGMCVTTDEIADEFQRRYSSRPTVMLCGYDPDDMPRAVEPPATGPMVLIHAGTLYGHRTPVPMLEAIAELRAAGRLGPDDLRLRLIGDATDLHGETPQHAIERLGLGSMVVVEASVSQAAAFAALLESHVGLLLAEGQILQLPAKTFDYVGMHRPVFALADGATAAFVQRYGIGFTANRSNVADALMQLTNAFRADRLRALSKHVAEIAPELSMASQVDLFERAVTAAAARPAA